MKSLKFPSKTFLLGEYSVLQGGDALLLCSPPMFEFSYQEAAAACPFHPDSEAGKLFSAERAAFNSKQFKFIDPHQGRGGFGASGAEFLGLALTLHPFATPWELLDLYRRFTQKGSGADLLAQSFTRGDAASFVHISFAEKLLEKRPLPAEGTFLLSVFHTGKKLNTHEYLQKSPAIPGTLKQVATDGINAWQTKRTQEFVLAIRSYGEELATAGLLASHSAALIAALYQEQKALAAKGCGAMGADVIISITEEAVSNDWCQQKKISKIFESWV